MAHIELRSISKSFGTASILSDVTLCVERGEFVSIVGPSGCGKSTLLRIMSGLEPQSAGDVVIDGRNADDVRPADRDLAMVFQSYALYPHLSVAQNIALPLRMRELSFWQRMPVIGRVLTRQAGVQAAIAARVADVARQVGLTDLMDRKPGQLSGGQRQRVALARAMVRRPKAFLMDEPLSNLDAAMRSQIRAEISGLHARLGATMIYVTHDQAEAMVMSDRIAVMMGGRLMQFDTPRAIYESPATLAVALFFGDPAINQLAGVLGAGGAIHIQGADLHMDCALPAGAEITAAIRPEHLLIDEEGTRPGGWHGTLTRIEYLGPSVHSEVTLSCGQRLLVQTPGHANRRAIGQHVRVTVPVERIMLFGPDGLPIRQIRHATAPCPGLAL